MNKNVKVGIIGLGYWGKNILRNLHELGVLHAAFDSDPEIVKQRKESFPDVNYTQSSDDILKNPEIQAVAIATPSDTHYELVKMALNAGKDVFVEKPLTLSLEHGEELVELAQQKERILMVGHILQYHPAVIKLKELIEQGELGRVEYIYSNRVNIGKLRIEEDILWGFAPHDNSVILMLVGDEPVSVGCFGGDYVSQGVHDVTLTTLEFKNDVKAHIFVSWLHPFKEQKLVVVGSKAMAVFDDLTVEKLFIYPHRIEWEDGRIPVAHKAEHYTVEIEEKEPLKEEMKHFIECVLTRETPKTDGREALRVLGVLDKAERSLKKGSRTVVASDNEEYFAHLSASIDEDVSIGEGTKVWHFCHILQGTRIGKNCVIGQNVMVGPDVTIGNNCKLQNNVSIYKAVTLENDVFCGPSCVFTNVYNPRAFIERKNEFLPTLVKKGATIGANATIVCGVTIGEYAMVGAGAVVKKDVPDYCIVAGVPARLIGYVCKCGVRLEITDDRLVCSSCGNKYKQEKGTIKPITEK
jgi:UDP-2-acetamido-3-amino-2,3-dideoxy-glucuronate N-acetyltransferase